MPSLEEQIDRLGLDEPEAAHSLPRSLYLDPAAFERECAAIFRRDWLCVARVDELPGPGDYLCLELFGEPVVLVRDASDTIRAFSNVCRHRSMRIAEGRGHATRFTCPYHRWSYDLDGTLAAAPAMDTSVGFDRASVCLPEFALECWQGWVFVSLDAAPEPLGPRLQALDALLEPYRLSEMRIASVLHFDSPWNWKVMVENFMESYHHIGPHAQTLQPTNPAFDTHVLDLEGPFAVLENPGKTADVPPFWAICVFPNQMFAVTRGETPLVFWYRMRIHSAEYFDLDIHVLLPPDAAANPDLVEIVRAGVDRIHREDIVVCEGVQAGLRSRLSEPGRINHLERANWIFQRFLGERLRAGTSY